MECSPRLFLLDLYLIMASGCDNTSYIFDSCHPIACWDSCMLGSMSPPSTFFFPPGLCYALSLLFRFPGTILHILTPA